MKSGQSTKVANRVRDRIPLGSPSRVSVGRILPWVAALAAMAMTVAACGSSGQSAASEQPTAGSDAPSVTSSQDSAADSSTGTDAATEGDDVAEVVPEKKQITVGVLPFAGTLPFAVAQHEGLFEKHGLEVKQALAEGGAAAAAALSGGSHDISQGSVVPFVSAQLNGLELTFAASEDVTTSNFSMVVTGPDTDINGPEDLKGKVIATNALINYGVLGMQETLSRSGLNPSDYQFTTMPFQDMPAAVVRGDVAAAWELEPFVTQARDLGARDVFDPFTGPMENFPADAFFCTKEFATENPNTVLAFRQAIDEAVGLINEDPDSYRPLLASYTNLEESLAERVTLSKYVTFDEMRGQLQRVPDMMLSAGFIDTPLDVAEWDMP